MILGVAGLGLIGGSFARAYKEAGHTVYAHDTDSTILGYAMLNGTVDKALTFDNIKECDLLLICTYIKAAAEYFQEAAPHIDRHTVVIDCLGVKKNICRLGFALAEKYGFTYVGGHPMAGTQYSGFKHSRANLFHNAPMVLVPPKYDDIELESFRIKLSKPIIDEIDKVLAKHYGFTEEELDFIINYDIKYRMGDELNDSE